MSGRVAVALAASRGVILLAAASAETVLSRNTALTAGAGGPILTSLTSWDGWWFLGIVRNGYHAAPIVDGYHDYAFLPLYPAFVRLLSMPWPNYAGLVAVVLSNILFVVALVLLVQLGREVLGDDRAERGAVLLAISPFAAPFSMAYSESLFLVLSIASFLAAERDRRGVSGILLALAALTRLQGLVLALPLWLLFLGKDRRRIRLSQAWVLLGPLAAAAFLLFVAWFTGAAGGYGAGQAGWGRIGPSGTPAGGSIATDLTTYQAVLVLTLLVAVFLLVYLRPDRIPLSYASIPPLVVATVIGSGLLESVGRYVTTAFPYGWVLAGRRGRWFRLAWPPVSLVLLFLVSVQEFRGYFVP